MSAEASTASVLLDNLQQLTLLEGGRLIGLNEKLRWIETEFRVMVPYLHSMDALLHDQLPNDLLESTRNVIRRTEDLIQTYVKRSYQSKKAPIYKRPILWAEKRDLIKKLGKIKDEIIQVRQGWRTLVVDFPNINNNNNGVDSAPFRSAMAKLDSSLQQQVVQHWAPLKDAVKWVKEELAPLHHLLQEIDHDHVLSGGRERQRIWINELRGIFLFVDESFQIPVSGSSMYKLRHIVSEIQGKILQLFRRYYVYGLGQIVRNNNNSNGPIFIPRIRMSVPIPNVSGTDIVIFVAYLVSLKLPSYKRWMPYSSWMTPRGPIETFEAELEMMKALLKDMATVSLSVDGRAKVWLDQVREISVELSQLVEDRRGMVRVGVIEKMTFDRRLKRIGSEIHDIAARRMTYDINTALGDESFQSQHYNHLFLEEIESSLSKGRPLIPGVALSRQVKSVTIAAVRKQVESVRIAAVRKQVESVRKELELMQALLRDVNGMEKQDARLKVWVMKMDGVACLANEVVALDTNSLSKRFQAVGKIKAIQNHILNLSKWKHTFDIRVGRSADIINPNLEGANEPFSGVFSLFRRRRRRSERDLMKASVMDILEIGNADILRALSSYSRDEDIVRTLSSSDDRISKTWNELDGITKAWVEEMVHLYKDKGATSDQLMDKTRQLSEIRVAYGIQIRQKRPPLIEVLPNSRENVPSYLRQCIYYFLLFPVNLEVPTRRLIALWVAEGLIHSKKYGDEPVEHTAEHYLNDLIDLGLVRITKKKLNGRVKACQLNDDGSMRGTWLEKAREARFFDDANECTTRLVDNIGTNGHSTSFIQVHRHVPNSSPNYRNVISFLSFDTQEGSKPGEDIGYFLNKCILAGFFLWLRVLDLERVFRPKLPKAITKLTLLRYLGLRWTYLEDLPEYVSMLLNLQVLDVKHTYITVLPKSIWSMRYLRHLYLSETYRTRFDDPPSDHRICLNEIQTLWGAFIDKNSSVERGLDTLLSLRKLGLSCRSVSSSQLEDVARWISKLKLLETLRLKSRDERGCARDLRLESLETNSKLSTVYLLGKLIWPSVVATFPDTLVEVTLSGSDLNWDDPMEYLGKLKNLVVLRLLSGSVMLSGIRCSGGSFPKLKAFKIWELPNLEDWDAEEGAMPCLEYLEIRCCKSLKMVPRALQHVETLREFRLRRMPERFIDDSRTMRPMVWSKVADVLEVVEQQPE